MGRIGNFSFNKRLIHMVDQVKEGIEAVAIEWWEHHKPHVERLMKSTNLAYAPSKSDIRIRDNLEALNKVTQND